jgi:plastocyanin
MRMLLSTILLVLIAAVPGRARDVFQVAEAHLDSDGVQRLELIADNYFYEPNYLVVQAGIPVELTITRGSWLVPHDFVLHAPEAGIDVSEPVERDGTKIRFTPTRPGKFNFYCDEQLMFFESHRGKGMEGVLEVKP